MAETETGWTDKYPHKSDAGDEYYFVRRKDRKDVVVMGFSMGKAWLNGVSYDPPELRSHLFLGPVSPSDFEQLTRLREAAGTLLENNGGPTTSIYGEYVLVRREDFEALAQGHTGGEKL